MDVLISNSEDKARVVLSIGRIIKESEVRAKELIDSNKILIITTSEIDSVVFDFTSNLLAKRMSSKGYGISLARIPVDKEIKRLIILNFEIIDELELNENELDALISHELGHMLNAYVAQPQIASQTLEEYKEANAINNECYADYFCKMTKTNFALISSMEKFRNSNHTNARSNYIFDKRLLQLQKDIPLVGIELPKDYI